MFGKKPQCHGYKMAAQNESSQVTIHVRKMKACSRLTEQQFGCSKSAT